MKDSEQTDVQHSRAYDAIVNSQDETVKAMRDFGLTTAAEQNLKDRGVIGEKDKLTDQEATKLRNEALFDPHK